MLLSVRQPLRFSSSDRSCMNALGAATTSIWYRSTRLRVSHLSARHYWSRNRKILLLMPIDKANWRCVQLALMLMIIVSRARLSASGAFVCQFTDPPRGTHGLRGRTAPTPKPNCLSNGQRNKKDDPRGLISLSGALVGRRSSVKWKTQKYGTKMWLRCLGFC